MTPENQAAAQEWAPERIYIHPADAEWRSNRWPQEASEYVEYVRADLLQQPASSEHEGEQRWATLKLTCNLCGQYVEHVCTAFLKDDSPAPLAEGEAQKEKVK